MASDSDARNASADHGDRDSPGRAILRAAHAGALAFTVFFSLYPRKAVDATFSAEVQSLAWLFHIGCYLLIASLHVAAYPGGGRSPFFRRLRLFAAYSLLGLALETGQALPVVNRSCSASDALANALGAALGAFLAPSGRRRRTSGGGRL